MLYIAYGSNLNMEQMAYRCPDAKRVTTAVLKDYKLVFKGSMTGSYLTIVKSKGDMVPVGVWRISKSDEKNLDRYEGYPSFYEKHMLTIPCTDGKNHRVMVYIMHENRVIGVPRKSYVDTCLKGYEDFGFNPDILIKAEEEAHEYCKSHKVPHLWS